MKKLLAVIPFVLGCLGAAYFVICWGIVDPITDVCMAIEASNLTSGVVGSAIVQFLLSDLIAGFSFLAGIVISGIITVFLER